MLSSHQRLSSFDGVAADCGGRNFVQWDDGDPSLQLTLLQQLFPNLLRLHDNVVQLKPERKTMSIPT